MREWGPVFLSRFSGREIKSAKELYLILLTMLGNRYISHHFGDGKKTNSRKMAPFLSAHVQLNGRRAGIQRQVCGSQSPVSSPVLHSLSPRETKPIPSLLRPLTFYPMFSVPIVPPAQGLPSPHPCVTGGMLSCVFLGAFSLLPQVWAEPNNLPMKFSFL